jgi:hypothetical protein
MKLPLAAAMAATPWALAGGALAGAPWAAHAQVLAQVLPSSGPGSLIPVGPDDTPLARRADGQPLRAVGLVVGMPGPYLPDPNDPTRPSKHPGSALTRE